MKTPKFKYKIIKKKKDQGDWEIEKLGPETLTLRDVATALREADKQVKEMAAQHQANMAFYKNVENHHPDVVRILKSLPGIKRKALELIAFYGRKGEESASNLKMAKRIKARLVAEDKDIRTQCGIK